MFQPAVGALVALLAAALPLAMGADGARRAAAFHLPVRAWVALCADVLQLFVGAGVARRTVVFQPAVRAGVAVPAVLFQLPLRAGVAVRAEVFHIAVRARVTLLALVFLPSMRAPLMSPHYSPARTCDCAPRATTGEERSRSFLKRSFSENFVTASREPEGLLQTFSSTTSVLRSACAH